MEPDRMRYKNLTKVTAPFIFLFGVIMGRPALNVAVLVLLPVFGVMVSAESYPNTPASGKMIGSLCKEVCELNNIVGNMVRQIHTCLNETKWKVSNANPVIVLTSNDNNKSKEGNRKTFSWRHFDDRPLGGTIRNVCNIRCIPRWPNTVETPVKSVRQISEHQRKSEQPNVNSVNTGISRAAVDNEPVDNEPNEYEDPSKTNNSSNLETPKVEAPPKETVLKGVVNSGTEIEGVCPGINALECLAVMKLERANQGQSNVEKLNDKRYSDNSFKIKVSGNEMNKVELANHQIEHLKYLGASYCNNIDPSQKPRVVHVENTSTNEVSKYVIVEEVGDMMIGCPYPPPSTPPVLTNRKQPSRTRPIMKRKRGNRKTPFIPVAEACVKGPLEHLESESLSRIRPEKLESTHFTHQNKGFRTEKPQPPKQIVTDLPKYTMQRQYGQDRTITDRPYLHNCGSCINRFLHDEDTWGTKETPRGIDTTDEHHGNENLFIPDEPQLVNNFPKIQETPYTMHDRYYPCNNDEENYNRLLMDANRQQQLLMDQRKPMGNTIQAINLFSPQRLTSERPHQTKLPEYLRSTHRYNYVEPCYSRIQYVSQRGRQGETRPTLPIGCSHNLMNGADKVSTHQPGHPIWGQNVIPKCQFARGMTTQPGGRCCELCGQTGYTTPTIGYPPIYNPVQPMVPLPVGYTLPPAFNNK